MRKILIRTANGRSWQPAYEAAFRTEAQLQELLHEDPSLIPFEDLGEDVPVPRAFVREAGLPGSGSTDLIGVDEAGRITIIECKLATNPEQKRKVIGQVLEYAAFLWRRKYDFLEHLFEKECRSAGKTNLADLVTPEGEDDWSEPDFRANVEASLDSGDFCLMVVVDSLNSELRKTIEYLNRKRRDGTTIYAVEIGHFSGDGFEVIAPRLVGPTADPPPPPGRWDADRFFEAASRQTSPAAYAVLQDLYEFTVREADACRWGRGADGSFTFRVERSGAAVSVFSACTSGRLWLNFGYMRRDMTENVVSRFADELAQLKGMADLEVRFKEQQFPSYMIEDTLVAPDAVESFKAAVLRARDSLGQ